MRSESEIVARRKYWDLVLAGLKADAPDLNDKIDTSEKRAVVARASVMTLNWVLIEAKKGEG